MSEPEIEDFDPGFDMLDAANWVLRAAEFADIVLKDHPEKENFCLQLRSGAVAMAQVHGQVVGAMNALEPFAKHLPEAQDRIDQLRRHYTEYRAEQIEILCNQYLKAIVMERGVNSGPGRPRKRIPNYDDAKLISDGKAFRSFVQEAWEFDIAIKLLERKKATGRYVGLTKLLNEAVEAGRIDEVGDTAQRVKRLAKQLYEESHLFLSPGLREARAKAQVFIYSGG